MGGEERNRNPEKLKIDFDRLLDGKKPEPQVQELFVVKNAITIEDDDDVVEEEAVMNYQNWPDKEIVDKIVRLKKILAEAKLPDGGVKINATLKALELELTRRTNLLKGDDNSEKAAHAVADKRTCAGSTEDRSTEDPLNVPAPQSTFTTLFVSRMDDKIANGKTRPFRDELSTLNPCNHKRAKVNGDLQSQSTHDVSSRQTTFKSPHLQINIDEPSKSSREISDKDSTGCLMVKAKAPNCRTTRSSRRNNQKSVVLVDEEEMEDDSTELAAKVEKSVEENRIYYPSRDDPKATVLCYSDVDCLDPESFVSCSIMNFYIRYLQKASPASTENCNFHFFNTYFYKKLQKDVLNKDDRETSFVKFRRWWKGVNIFEKAYIFIPIHESLHWSLVIICIPHKGDESGITVLHLDSLKLHPSKSIFKDVKSFLIEEWNYLKKGREEVLSELPLADKVWHRLSRKIIEKVIEVPQQKNEYDCGIFVLFFMERFLSDAPERLMRKDLDKFGRDWFKPEEASDLRLKIRNLLEEEFAKAKKDTHNSDS